MIVPILCADLCADLCAAVTAAVRPHVKEVGGLEPEGDSVDRLRSEDAERRARDDREEQDMPGTDRNRDRDRTPRA